MDICKCGESGLDAEEGYSRMMGSYKFLESYDYNFFDELVLCMLNQLEGIDKDWAFNFIKSRFPPLCKDKIVIGLGAVLLVRQLEDEILESLK
jgi:hypothetical protein